MNSLIQIYLQLYILSSDFIYLINALQVLLNLKLVVMCGLNVVIVFNMFTFDTLKTWSTELVSNFPISSDMYQEKIPNLDADNLIFTL